MANTAELFEWKGTTCVKLSAGGYEAWVANEIGSNVIRLRDNANGLEFFRFSDDNTADLCCYPSEQILVCEQSSDRSRIKMNLCSIQELNERIISGVNAVKKGEQTYPEEQLIAETDELIEKGKLLPNGTVTLWVEKSSLVSGKRADLFLFENEMIYFY